MSFVKLENLNDFIAPGVSCVKPVEKKAPGVVAKVNEISLSDCLACSGCITSAETVLVQQQNYDELFKIINDNKTSKANKTVVVSLSLQSISSLAHKYSLDVQEASERLASFFVSLGCSKVYDINLARHLSLIESFREFKARRDNQRTKLPIINSACPGWICYAEKTNGDLIIPHLSRVRSPQQIMGALVKELYCSQEKKERSEVYHVTLMPCFDKKLEASRTDFKDSSEETPDVDCVLTPIELEEILRDEGVSLADFERRKLDIIAKLNAPFDNPLTSHLGSPSGGFAENLLLAEACEQSHQDLSDIKPHIQYMTSRNSDFIELQLDKSFIDANSCDRLSKFVIVNGFRNIQTVVQRLKRNALKYDYIEIMACPSGCINGGAQCRPQEGEDQSDAIEAARRLYKSVDAVEISIDPDDDSNTSIYEQLALGSTKEQLYTNFHSVPKMQNLTVNW